MYKLKKGGVLRISDNAFIPNSIENRDWKEYNAWVEAGNVPYAEFDIEELKALKIKKLDRSCNAEILNGFTSNALGTDHRYSSNEEAQRNLLGAVRRSDKGFDTPYVCTDTDGAKDMLIHTPSQMLKVYDDGESFKIECIQKFHTLRKQVEDSNCNTEEKINTIIWKNE